MNILILFFFFSPLPELKYIMFFKGKVAGVLAAVMLYNKTLIEAFLILYAPFQI